MDANLVRAASIDLNFQQAEFAVRRIQLALHRVMADGFAPASPPRGHARAPHLITADATADGSALTLQPALHQGHIFLLDLPRDELRGQSTMSLVTLRYHNQSAGGLVQAMHDSRTQLAPHRRKLPEVVQPGIDPRD